MKKIYLVAMQFIVVIFIFGCVSTQQKSSPNYFYLAVSPDVQKSQNNYYVANNLPIEVNLALGEKIQASSIVLLLTLKTPSGKTETIQQKAKVSLECHPCDQIAGQPNSCHGEPCILYPEPPVLHFTTTKSETGQYEITGKILDQQIEVKPFDFTVMSRESVDKIINS